jgi:hypothetical protein
MRIVRNAGGKGKASASFCEQKEAKKLLLFDVYRFLLAERGAGLGQLHRRLGRP